MPSGFATALTLAAGAVGGWGTGQLEKIKMDREEKLKQLDITSAERLQKFRQEFEAGEGDKSRALQSEQIAATRDAAAATTALNEKLGMRGLDIDERRITSAETISREQIQANKDLAADAAKEAQSLNAKLTRYIDPDDPDKFIDRMTKPNGELVKNPVDENGKELTIADTTEDTDDIKSLKGLMRLTGWDAEKAADRLYQIKEKADNWQTRKEAYYKSMVDGASTMKNLTAADFDALNKKATEFADRDFPGEGPSGAAPAPSSATEPAATTPDSTVPETAAESDEDLKFPPGTTEAEAITWAKQQIAADMSRAAVAKVLKVNGIDPRKAGL